jgi:N-methylhydantoinase A
VTISEASAQTAQYRIAVDTGGTFTDVVLATPEGDLRLAKAPTDHRTASGAVLEALAELAAGEGLSVDTLLGRTAILVYGTTRATNAVVEQRLPRVGFITSAGFPDVLLLREGGKRNAFQRVPFPEPLVPRYLTFEVKERIDPNGAIRRPLDEEHAETLLVDLREANVEAVGVCLLWSVVNPVHELRVGELVTKYMPDIPVTLSHEVNPIIREYRRAAATVIDAGLKKLMGDHLARLAADLRDRGFAGNFLTLTAVGGAWPFEDLQARPVYAVGSGPSVAPVGALAMRDADPELGRFSELIVCDAGGTTFDVSVVRGESIEQTSERWLGEPGASDLLGIGTVDVHSIGAGGGSIGSVDDGGFLSVGPESAAADPGPACYGKGGTRPTVTDAAVVLGYLDPGGFLGGRMTLDAEAAYRAVETHIAEPLGISVLAAAQAIMTVAVENSVSAIKEITVARGHDPRRAAIVAGGGASGLSIVEVARALQCANVLIPRLASGLSACGAQACDLIAEFAVNLYVETRDINVPDLNRVIMTLREQGTTYLNSMSSVSVEERRLSYGVDARYPRQAWELSIDLGPLAAVSASTADQIEDAFHREHMRVLGVQDRGQYLECIRWWCRATARLAKPTPRSSHRSNGRPQKPDVRPVCFDGHYFVETLCYDADALIVSEPLNGAAVVTSPTTTIVLPPGATMRRTAHGNFVIFTGVSSDHSAAHLGADGREGA